ncbi:MAG: molybdate ABC transporter substrate-binding protein [Vampirovibrionia bacterium]
MINKTLTFIFALILNIAICYPALCEEITVGTLRDFKPLMEELQKDFTKENTDITINFITDKEDALIEQIQITESPIDLLFLDNAELINHLGQIEVIDKNSIKYIGKDQLCVVVKKSIPMRAFMLYPRTYVMKGLIIANPSQTALGKYTKEALTNLGLYKKSAKKILLLDSNSTIVNIVKTGHYDGGIMYCSYAQNSFVDITDKLNTDIYSKIKYTTGIKKGIKEDSAVYKFNNYLKSNKAKKILQQFHISN